MAFEPFTTLSLWYERQARVELLISPLDPEAPTPGTADAGCDGCLLRECSPARAVRNWLLPDEG